MGIETLIGAGVGLYGALQSRNAAKRQAQAAERGIQAQTNMFNKQMELNEPFRQAGLAGQNRYMELIGLGGNTGAAGYGRYAKDPTLADIQMDPGYQFRLTEGLKALDRRNAAGGMGYRGGAATKAATRYSQDYASGEYGRAFDRYGVNRANQLNPLLALMGQGQIATGAMTGAAGTQGQNLSAGYGAIGNAQAAGRMGMANALAGGVGQGMNFYQNDKLMNMLAGTRNYPGYGQTVPGISSGFSNPSGYTSEYEMR